MAQYQNKYAEDCPACSGSGCSACDDVGKLYYCSSCAQIIKQSEKSSRYDGMLNQFSTRTECIQCWKQNYTFKDELKDFKSWLENYVRPDDHVDSKMIYDELNDHIHRLKQVKSFKEIEIELTALDTTNQTIVKQISHGWYGMVYEFSERLRDRKHNDKEVKKNRWQETIEEYKDHFLKYDVFCDLDATIEDLIWNQIEDLETTDQRALVLDYFTNFNNTTVHDACYGAYSQLIELLLDLEEIHHGKKPVENSETEVDKMDKMVNELYAGKSMNAVCEVCEHNAPKEAMKNLLGTQICFACIAKINVECGTSHHVQLWEQRHGARI